MPMKCILEHCEFACGGYCALVCPKDLSKRIERKEAKQKIDACVEMLKRVRSHTKRVREDGLPVGVSFSKGLYVAYISYKGKQKQLGAYADPEKAEEVRAKAEEAKKKGRLPEWLKEFEAVKKKAKKGKRTATKGSASI